MTENNFLYSTFLTSKALDVIGQAPVKGKSSLIA